MNGDQNSMGFCFNDLIKHGKKVMCPKGTVLGILARNSASRHESIHYSLNQIPIQEYIESIGLLGVGRLPICVKVIDLLENVAEIKSG